LKLKVPPILFRTGYGGKNALSGLIYVFLNEERPEVGITAGVLPN